MAHKEVTFTIKDADGNITAVSQIIIDGNVATIRTVEYTDGDTDN